MNPIHRRDFLAGMAGVAAAPLAAEAKPLHANVRSDAQLFVLADPRRVSARRFADEQVANGARATAWQEDPYRWWHEGVAPVLAELPSGQRVCLDGCTTWADYLVLVGEATRAGFRPVVAPHSKRARRETRAATLFTWRLVAMA